MLQPLGHRVDGDPIPADVRRFLQSNPLSIPHIEMIALLRREAAIAWTDRDIARRLYVSEERVGELVTGLEAIGIVERVEATPRAYYYRPASRDLALLLDRLDAVYAKHLVAVTKLVHAARGEAAEQFAKAFRFRKED